MVRTIWALAKIAIVLAAVVWIAEHPGRIQIDWLSYNLDFHVGFFFVVFFLALALGIFIFSVIKSVLDMPKTLTRYNDMTAKDKAVRALSIGLSAVAAGDTKEVSRQASKVKNYLSDTNPLSLFLEAQAARLNGDEAEASQAYLALMKDKDAGFMGVRGLLQVVLDRGDYEGALELGYKALRSYPKKGWILSIVYDLEIQARHWDKALRILTRAEKAEAIMPNKAASDRIVISLAQALEYKNSGDEKAYFRGVQKAYKLDKDFLPSSLWLADLYIERGKYKSAIAVIEKSWNKMPHPELTCLWAKAYRPPRNSGPVARIRWFEKILKIDPNSVEGLQAMASVLTQEGLWGDARKHLEMAEKIRPNVHLYKLWAQLEEKATGKENAVRAWEEKAADAPRERVWICSETGRVYDEWMPISDQGLFNTIIWDFPQGRSFNMPHLQIARPVAGLIGSAL